MSTTQINLIWGSIFVLWAFWIWKTRRQMTKLEREQKFKEENHQFLNKICGQFVSAQSRDELPRDCKWCEFHISGNNLGFFYVQRVAGHCTGNRLVDICVDIRKGFWNGHYRDDSSEKQIFPLEDLPKFIHEKLNGTPAYLGRVF